MKREAALMRRRRWATAAGTWQQEKGLKLFVGSDKQMVPLPAGKRLLWVLCLSNMWTQYKKEGGVGWGGVGWGGVGCGPAAVLQPRGAHKDPGSPQQHWLCQRMSVIHGLTEVILSSPRQCSGVPFCQRRSKRRWEEAREEQREEAARTRGGGVLSQPGLMRAPCHCPKITIALFWSFVHSCWQWLLTKQLDMERIWPPPLTPPPTPHPPTFSSLGGLGEQERKQVCGLHEALDFKRFCWGLWEIGGRQRGVEALPLTKRSRRGGKLGRRRKRRKERTDFFTPQILLSQTDAKADGSELAENGHRRNETVY